MSNANGGFVSVLLTHLLNFKFGLSLEQQQQSYLGRQASCFQFVSFFGFFVGAVISAVCDDKIVISLCVVGPC